MTNQTLFTGLSRQIDLSPLRGSFQKLTAAFAELDKLAQDPAFARAMRQFGGSFLVSSDDRERLSAMHSAYRHRQTARRRRSRR